MPEIHWDNIYPRWAATNPWRFIKKVQKGSVSFAAILPAINMTKNILQSLLENDTPMENLRQDRESFTDMCADKDKPEGNQGIGLSNAEVHNSPS